MDLILIISFVFGLVYLALEQARVNTERRLAGSLLTRRSTVTATKWGMVLSVHPHK
jgi:hypothetical protein